jgi:septal ring-binding cell division protein DamX
LSGNFISEAYPRASDRRLHLRQRVLLSCLQLKDDNGGIVLDISEQGLSMQTVKSLEDNAYTELRFQLSQSNDWVEARGRIAWISASKRTAGVEFIDLSYESLISVKNWLSSIESPNASQEENAAPEGLAPPKSAVIFDEAADATSIAEPAKADIVVEEPVQELIAEDPAPVLHRVETKDAGAASGHAIGENERGTPRENVGPPARGPELTLFRRSISLDGSLTNNELRGASSKRRAYIGLLISAALLLSVVMSLGYFLRKSTNRQPEEKPLSSEKQPEAAPTSSMIETSTSSMVAPQKPVAPPDAGFILQVAAMKDENDAISFADSLRQKGFPAYVFKPAAVNFYRILIGPYSDADSAVKVEEKLRTEGFQVIRKRNTPDQ